MPGSTRTQRTAQGSHCIARLICLLLFILSTPLRATAAGTQSETTEIPPDFPFAIHILLFEGVEEEPVRSIISRLEREFGFPVKVLEARPAVDPEWKDPERNQYPALRVFEAAAAYAPENSARFLAFFPEDLYIGQMGFVFGLAHPDSKGALVSQFRLLSGEKSRQAERLYGEALHELGHTFGLKHCDPETPCVMRVARTVRAADARPNEFDPACRKKLDAAIGELKAALLQAQNTPGDGEQKKGEENSK